MRVASLKRTSMPPMFIATLSVDVDSGSFLSRQELIVFP